MGRFPMDGHRFLRIFVVSTVVLFGLAIGLLLTPSIQTALIGTGQYGKHIAFAPDQRCSYCHSATHRAPLTGPCENCHTTATWHSVDHQHLIAAMDVGVHAKVACALCHVRGGVPVGTRCEDCHRTSQHVFTPGCEKCHNPVDWQYALSSPARHVRLIGPHAPISCLDCHSLLEKPVVFRCTVCHSKHTAAFQLTRGHKLDCLKCHDQTKGRDNLNVAGISGADCIACHSEPPRHTGLSACGRCHSTSTWTSSTFAHASVYPLTGRHSRTSCAACHPSGDLGRVRSGSCSGCHGSKHQTYISCDRCHTTSAWSPAKVFAHPSSYPLVGFHRTVPCASCHQRLIFPGAFTKCVDCHKKLSHGHADCETCHTPKGWKIILPGGMG